MLKTRATINIDNDNDTGFLFFINTPAQVHFWRNIIRELASRGHGIKVIAREYGATCELLNSSGIVYDSFKTCSRASLRYLDIPKYIRRAIRPSGSYHPSVIIGFGVGESIAALFCRKPCIVFTDSEPVPLQNFITRLTGSVIITPDCFTKKLGRKHVRTCSYKELAYLHPNCFQPDRGIYRELGLAEGTHYVILRFNVFDAMHDVGRCGFPEQYQVEMVRQLGKYARVFIAPEKEVPPGLRRYILPVESDRIHHVLYYAQLLVTDTQTMATEAAILGTPVVRCNNFVGPGDMGNFIELENKYELIYSFRDPVTAMKKAVMLLQQPGLKETWAAKRQRLISEKTDITGFMVDFLETWPQSFEKYRDRQSSGL